MNLNCLILSPAKDFVPQPPFFACMYKGLEDEWCYLLGALKGKLNIYSKYVSPDNKTNKQVLWLMNISTSYCKMYGFLIAWRQF